MVSVPQKNSQQSSCQCAAENFYERKNSCSQGFSYTMDEPSYAVTLLLGALEDLAEDVSLQQDVNVDFLVTKALLASSLKISNTGLSKRQASLKRHFNWIFELFES